MNAYDIGLVIPCLNEGDNLHLLFEKCASVSKIMNCEFVIVENGSTDNSREVLSKIPLFENIRVVYLDVNKGYGGGIRHGLSYLDNRIVGWMHADLQIDPMELLSIMDLKTNELIFIKGSRVNRRFLDRLFTFAMSVIMTLLFRTHLWDINSQPTLMSKELVSKWTQPPLDFTLDLYAFVIAKRQKANVKRFRVDFKVRKHGKSSWNTGLTSRIALSLRTLRFALDLVKSGDLK